MMQPIPTTQFELPPEGRRGGRPAQSQVRDLLATLYAPTDLGERRRSSRYPFPYLIRLHPVGSDGRSPDPDQQTIVVVGKHLSEDGLGFYHREPISHRRMIASLESSDGVTHAFVIDLSWCRFTKQGWYESGGRFLESVTMVQGEVAAPGELPTP